MQKCFILCFLSIYTKQKLKWPSAVLFRNFWAYYCKPRNIENKSFLPVLGKNDFKFQKRTLKRTFNFHFLRIFVSKRKKSQIIPNTNSNGPRLWISQICGCIFEICDFCWKMKKHFSIELIRKLHINSHFWEFIFEKVVL